MGCQVLLEHGIGSGNHEDTQSQRRRTLGWREAVTVVGVLGMSPSLEGKNPSARFFPDVVGDRLWCLGICRREEVKV